MFVKEEQMEVSGEADEKYPEEDPLGSIDQGM